MHYDTVARVLRELEKNQVEYVVFGAVALNLLGLARSTDDLDLFIAPTAENVDRLKAALRAVFADPQIEDIRAEDLLGDYPSVQYVPPTGEFHLDILTRLGEAYRFEDLEIRTVDMNGLPVRVVTPRTLYRMKKDTVRLKDRADAEALRRRFGLDDE